MASRARRSATHRAGREKRGAAVAGAALGGLIGLGPVGPGPAGPVAQAAGYGLREQSAVGQGASFAGSTARADDPSTVYYNPAGMTALPGFQTVIGGAYIMPDATLSGADARRAGVLGRTTVTGRGSGDAADSALVPSSYATFALSPTLHAGVGLTAPWGLTTAYDRDFVGRYHAERSTLTTINLAPALAWRATPTLSLGAALQVQYAYANLSNAVDYGAVGALAGLGRLGFRPGGADGRSVVQGDDVGLGWQVGALWEPRPGTRLGASFRSAVFHELRGDVRFEGVPGLLQARFLDTAARARFATPEVASAGLAQALGPRWRLLADVSWTNWSRFQELRVRPEGRADSVTDERWRDSWFYALGAEYRAAPAVTLRAGAAYDQSPVPAATRTPRIPDTDRWWLSAGASWRVRPGMELTVAYSHVFARDPGLALRDNGPGTTDFLRGDLNARYRANVDIVALQAKFSF